MMHTPFCLTALLLGLWRWPVSGAHDVPNHIADLPFRNTSLSWEERVNDVVSRLSIKEMQDLIGRPSLGPIPGGYPGSPIPRLGIKPFQFFATCDRGYEKSTGNATNFPSDIGLAASFSPDLVYRVSEAAAVESRAKHNNFTKHNDFKHHTGVVCMSPVLDLFRDPRWGRNQETRGEDPYMVGVLGAIFVIALQGDHPRYIRAVAACAHFAAYSGPENIPVSRLDFNVEISEANLRMTFFPAFRACVEAGAYAFGTAYNAINGVPCVANKWLLTDVLRKEWGFQGFVMADAGSVEMVQGRHHYATDPVHVAAACVNAGTNVEHSGHRDRPYYLYIEEAVKQGKISESTLRNTVKPVFTARMRLGEFDPPEMNPYVKYDVRKDVESAQHQELAVEAALKTFVLLKNDGILPLQHSGHYHSIAVVGPMADDTEQLQGCYRARTDDSYLTSPLHALRDVAHHVRHASGCHDTKCKIYNAHSVLEAIGDTKLIFVLLGSGQAVECENRDRPDLELPGQQKQLLLDVMHHAGNTPIIVMLFSGGPLNVTFLDDDDRVSAIVQCFFPGQAAGDAIRRFMFNNGTASVPAGRLPFTWPALASQIPPMTNYSMEGRTYRYTRESPLYPFGFGLSYVTFHYSALHVPTSLRMGHDLQGSVVVTNTGHVTADEVIQVYIEWRNSSLPAPKLQLAWFDRLTVHHGNHVTVQFVVKSSSMALWIDNQWKIPEGEMGVYVGGQQPDQKKKAPSNVLSAVFTLRR